MSVILLSVIVGIVLFVMRVKEAYSYHRKIQIILTNHSMTTLKHSLIIQVLFIIGLIFSILFLIYNILNYNEINLSLAFIILCLFSSELIYVYYHSIFYYKDNGCILQDTFVKYKNIKTITLKPIFFKLSRYEITTSDHKTYVVSEKIGNLVKEKSSR